MKNLLPICLLLCVSLGCENTATNRAVTTNAAPSASPKTYAPDLIGQSKRINDEGINDETIRKNLADVDKSITYELLKKNADKQAGKAWMCKGKILEIAEKDGVTVARIGLDDWGNKVIYATGPIETTFVEKDHIVAIGYLAGSHSYTSQANWQITIPALSLRAMIAPKDLPKYQTAAKKPKVK